MLKWLLKLLGGVPEKDYEKLEKENTYLNARISKLEADAASYATLKFPDTGEFSFTVNSKCPYSLMVKKGTELEITGYKNGEKLDKIYYKEG